MGPVPAAAPKRPHGAAEGRAVLVPAGVRQSASGSGWRWIGWGRSWSGPYRRLGPGTVPGLCRDQVTVRERWCAEEGWGGPGGGMAVQGRVTVPKPLDCRVCSRPHERASSGPQIGLGGRATDAGAGLCRSVTGGWGQPSF
jgi:hypothetical protein